jgi:hypothetical protein
MESREILPGDFKSSRRRPCGHEKRIVGDLCSFQGVNSLSLRIDGFDGIIAEKANPSGGIKIFRSNEHLFLADFPGDVEGEKDAGVAEGRLVGDYGNLSPRIITSYLSGRSDSRCAVADNDVMSASAGG